MTEEELSAAEQIANAAEDSGKRNTALCIRSLVAEVRRLQNPSLAQLQAKRSNRLAPKDGDTY